MKTRKSDTYKKSYSIVAAAETLGQQQFIKHQKRHKLYIFWSRIILFVAFWRFGRFRQTLAGLTNFTLVPQVKSAHCLCTTSKINHC